MAENGNDNQPQDRFAQMVDSLEAADNAANSEANPAVVPTERKTTVADLTGEADSLGIRDLDTYTEVDSAQVDTFRISAREAMRTFHQQLRDNPKAIKETVKATATIFVDHIATVDPEMLTELGISREKLEKEITSILKKMVGDIKGLGALKPEGGDEALNFDNMVATLLKSYFAHYAQSFVKNPELHGNAGAVGMLDDPKTLIKSKNRFLIFVKGLIDNGLVGASAYTSYLGGAHYGGMAMDTVRRQWPGTFDSPDTQILARNLAGAGSALLIAVILKSLKKRVRNAVNVEDRGLISASVRSLASYKGLAVLILAVMVADTATNIGGFVTKLTSQKDAQAQIDKATGQVNDRLEEFDDAFKPLVENTPGQVDANVRADLSKEELGGGATGEPKKGPMYWAKDYLFNESASSLAALQAASVDPKSKEDRKALAKALLHAIDASGLINGKSMSEEVSASLAEHSAEIEAEIAEIKRIQEEDLKADKAIEYINVDLENISDPETGHFAKILEIANEDLKDELEALYDDHNELLGDLGTIAQNSGRYDNYDTGRLKEMDVPEISIENAPITVDSMEFKGPNRLLEDTYKEKGKYLASILAALALLFGATFTHWDQLLLPVTRKSYRKDRERAEELNERFYNVILDKISEIIANLLNHGPFQSYFKNDEIHKGYIKERLTRLFDERFEAKSKGTNILSRGLKSLKRGLSPNTYFAQDHNARVKIVKGFMTDPKEMSAFLQEILPGLRVLDPKASASDQVDLRDRSAGLSDIAISQESEPLQREDLRRIRSTVEFFDPEEAGGDNEVTLKAVIVALQDLLNYVEDSNIYEGNEALADDVVSLINEKLAEAEQLLSSVEGRRGADTRYRARKLDEETSALTQKEALERLMLELDALDGRLDETIRDFDPSIDRISIQERYVDEINLIKEGLEDIEPLYEADNKIFPANNELAGKVAGKAEALIDKVANLENVSKSVSESRFLARINEEVSTVESRTDAFVRGYGPTANMAPDEFIGALHDALHALRTELDGRTLDPSQATNVATLAGRMGVVDEKILGLNHHVSVANQKHELTELRSRLVELHTTMKALPEELDRIDDAGLKYYRDSYAGLIHNTHDDFDRIDANTIFPENTELATAVKALIGEVQDFAANLENIKDIVEQKESLITMRNSAAEITRIDFNYDDENVENMRRVVELLREKLSELQGLYDVLQSMNQTLFDSNIDLFGHTNREVETVMSELSTKKDEIEAIYKPMAETANRALSLDAGTERTDLKRNTKKWLKKRRESAPNEVRARNLLSLFGVGEYQLEHLTPTQAAELQTTFDRLTKDIFDSEREGLKSREVTSFSKISTAIEDDFEALKAFFPQSPEA
ncbi:hypothetical protein HOF67_02575 [Candidatus Peregrinibacteria bacterium]|jgi:hypothetical protein|nr:hypothetical protein [Candidatus Peregrinibacteria bacterium]